MIEVLTVLTFIVVGAALLAGAIAFRHPVPPTAREIAEDIERLLKK